jgi:hypothetical protein
MFVSIRFINIISVNRRQSSCVSMDPEAALDGSYSYTSLHAVLILGQRIISYLRWSWCSTPLDCYYKIRSDRVLTADDIGSNVHISAMPSIRIPRTCALAYQIFHTSLSFLTSMWSWTHSLISVYGSMLPEWAAPRSHSINIPTLW